MNDHHRDLVSIYGMDCGYANGYVAIPTDHPLYGKSYDEAYEAGITAHGGLTYSDSIVNVLSNFDLRGVDWLDGEVPEDYWVFGFDTMHAGDTLAFWSCEKCIEETKRLKEQFENYE
jgi:hypothetical protein